jgi:transposase InsO family protein
MQRFAVLAVLVLPGLEPAFQEATGQETAAAPATRMPTGPIVELDTAWSRACGSTRRACAPSAGSPMPHRRSALCAGASRGTYGSPRVHAQLQKEDVRAGKARVERLMRADGLRGKIRRRFRTTTDSKHALSIAPNTLGRQFTVEAPDLVWAGDITYIPIGSGFSFLAVIVDLYSRRVVGWAMADHLRTELVEDALAAALGARVPAPNMVHHSDRGCQYASAAYREMLALHGIEVSMSRRGNLPATGATAPRHARRSEAKPR